MFVTKRYLKEKLKELEDKLKPCPHYFQFIRSIKYDPCPEEYYPWGGPCLLKEQRCRKCGIIKQTWCVVQLGSISDQNDVKRLIKSEKKK